jgi:hypothetical protein
MSARASRRRVRIELGEVDDPLAGVRVHEDDRVVRVERAGEVRCGTATSEPGPTATGARVGKSARIIGPGLKPSSVFQFEWGSTWSPLVFAGQRHRRRKLRRRPVWRWTLRGFRKNVDG